MHNYRGTKSVPLFLYTDRSPRAWATRKRDTLLGQAQNGARAGGVVFTVVKFPRAVPPSTRVRGAGWRGVRDVGGMRGAVSKGMRHVAVNVKGGGPRLPHKKEENAGARLIY